MSQQYKLFTLLSLTHKEMFNARRRELESSGICMTRAWALWGLRVMERPANIVEMAQILDSDHQTTSQLLKRIEKEGW